MGTLDLGPFPRRPLRYPLTPSRVFVEGIPGLPEAEGTPWLQADAAVSGAIALGDSTPSPSAVEGLCEAAPEAGTIQATSGTFPTYMVSMELQCPVRVSGGQRQRWWDQARRDLLDYILDAAVEDQVSASGATSWDAALQAAVEYLNYQYGSAGMIGLPAPGFQELADYLRYESDGVYTNTGHRVWLRGTRSSQEDDIVVTPDVFYESRTEEYEYPSLEANVDTRRVTVYVKAVFDLPGLLISTSES